MDTYSMNSKSAQCCKCGKFMPWERSNLIERSDGLPLPSLVLIEKGVCKNCEINTKE